MLFLSLITKATFVCKGFGLLGYHEICSYFFIFFCYSSEGGWDLRESPYTHGKVAHSNGKEDHISE